MNDSCFVRRKGGFCSYNIFRTLQMFLFPHECWPKVETMLKYFIEWRQKKKNGQGALTIYKLYGTT